VNDASPGRRITYREATRQAIRAALQADPRVFLMGEDVGRYGGCFAVTKGLLQEFGAERIRDTPLSESAFVGAGIGAALGGLRPIVEIISASWRSTRSSTMRPPSVTCPAASCTCRS
jgi:pyruvate/2-oxoglutarate/acetoin dehydrogenase E1 component